MRSANDGAASAKCVKVGVASAPKDYEVWIGEGLLSQAGRLVAAACGGAAALIVTDDAVGRLHGDAAERSLQDAGYKTRRYAFPNGERSKTFETYALILDAMSDVNLTRQDALVALGGGVVGDMAGFAAATYLRGVKLAQMPTTLLAMVDASVGGKTGVDMPTGKNQVGAFYQPSVVICDTAALRTLPREAFDDGCAEMVKHGAILSPELFELMKEPIEPQIEDLIARNVTIKRDIVAKDEKDFGIRQILNFGHTVGHAVERNSFYRVSHGKAVAIGMAAESRGAWRMGICGEDCHLEIVEAVKRCNLPSETDIPPEMLVKAALFDKKRGSRSITLYLPERVGKCVAKSFDLDGLAEFIRLCAQA